MDLMDLIVANPLSVLLAAVVIYATLLILGSETVPKVTVSVDEEEREDTLQGRKKVDPTIKKTDCVPCWDPATMNELGEAPVMSDGDVHAAVARCQAAQAEWGKSDFKQRRTLLKILLRFIVENQETITRVACRESGKTQVDALFGEVLVTCEKLKWTIANGEKYLRPEKREPGTLMMMKTVRVEYHPLGVIGAIVPWNYPFHNVLNPIIASLFAGNGIVIKVSEYASWSIKYYGRMINACLEAAGAPTDLVQFVTGYGATGNALVTCKGVDKVIFVGSPGVGVKVMEAAAKNLTPVVLELGGKDPFVVCEDADLSKVIQIACRGVFQNMGQNCAGPERFFVYESAYEKFCSGVTSVVKQCKLGATLGDSAESVDCGAITMGSIQMAHYQKLVDDAVSKGAKVLAGGAIPGKDSPLHASKGSFYPPTILADVPSNALIAQEEIFGPIMCIFKVPGDSDEQAVAMANDCSFGLSSCAFSADAGRASRVASKLKAGMSAVNDLEGTTYMSQSLPFGGRGASGYDRFAGPEGLRGLCLVRSVSEDYFPFAFLQTAIPAPLQYPGTRGGGPLFASGLVQATYGYGVGDKVAGVAKILKSLMK